MQLYEINRDLPDIFGITSQPWKGLFGLAVVGIFFIVSALVIHILLTWSKFHKKIFERTSFLQYAIFQFFAIVILVAMPVKLILRLWFPYQVRDGHSVVQHLEGPEGMGRGQ